MAQWSRNKKNPNEINGGNEFNIRDGIKVDDMNANFNNNFYAVEMVDNLSASASTLPSGSQATATIIEDNTTGYKKIVLGIPQGIQGIQGIQGKSINYNSNYNANSTYYNNDTRLDVVYYNGSTYSPKNENVSGIIPTDNNYWNIFSSKGADGLGGNMTANNLSSLQVGKIYACKNIAVQNNTLTCELVETPSIENVVSKSQGNNNANKIMVTDNNGTIIPKNPNDISVGKLGNVNASDYATKTFVNEEISNNIKHLYMHNITLEYSTDDYEEGEILLSLYSSRSTNYDFQSWYNEFSNYVFSATGIDDTRKNIWSIYLNNNSDIIRINYNNNTYRQINTGYFSINDKVKQIF